jgi:hypothetical protein
MQMQRPELMRLVFGVGMLTIVMLALSACGGGSSAQEEQQANKVHHIPEDSQVYEGKPLPAGRYDTEEFKPSMSFTLEKGWSRGGAELREIWDLQTSRTTRFGSYLPAPRRSGIPKALTG